VAIQLSDMPTLCQPGLTLSGPRAAPRNEKKIDYVGAPSAVPDCHLKSRK
jgi:hypothetical protein